MTLKKIIVVLAALVVAAVMFSLGSAEEKKMNFFSKGRALYEKGNYAGARTEFRNALQIDPRFAEGYHMLGMTALKTEEFKEAFGHFSTALNFSPDIVDAQIQLARLFIAGGQPEKAERKIELVLSREPGNEKALLLLSSLHLRRGRTPEAMGILTRLNEKHPGSPAVISDLVRLYTVGEEYEKAMALCRGYRRNAPEDAFSHHLAAGVHIAQKQYAEAEEELNRAIALRPGWSAPRSTLAKVCLVQGKKARAAELFEAAVPGLTRSLNPRKLMWLTDRPGVGFHSNGEESCVRPYAR